MPADSKNAQQAKGVLEGLSRHGKRATRAVCSLFVPALLALAVTQYIYGADVRISFKLHAEAAFTTVEDRGPNRLPEKGPSNSLIDLADVIYTVCQCPSIVA